MTTKTDLFPQDPGTTPETNAQAASFESLVEQLDRLVLQLESGKLSLEESLQAFDTGMAISKRAAAILDAAEHRLEQLGGTPDRPELRSMDDPQ